MTAIDRHAEQAVDATGPTALMPNVNESATGSCEDGMGILPPAHGTVCPSINIRELSPEDEEMLERAIGRIRL